MPKPAESSSDFAQRLAFALKATNLSRAQLASAVEVDKSLVSRWLSGQVVPTSHNLARISEAIARLKSGFNAVLWERPESEFEGFFGIAQTKAVAQSTSEAFH